jgi:predicted GNAT family N-acyltransferase
LHKRKNEPEFRIEPLGQQHDRAAFSCREAPLTKYLHTQARQDLDKRLTAVFILTPDSRTVAGYYTLAQYRVETDKIPEEITRKLTRYREIPATLIGRLAMSTAFEGRRLGEFLLFDALNRCLVNSRQVASWAVIVDAKSEKAITFYKKYDFIDLPTVPNRLFLPMAAIARMFA